MSIEAAVRDEVARELHRIMNVSKFGEEIIAERLRDAVLKLSVVSAITGLPSSTLYRKVQQGGFPAPIKLGESASGWLLSEVEAWIVARREERDAGSATNWLAKREQGTACDAARAPDCDPGVTPRVSNVLCASLCVMCDALGEDCAGQNRARRRFTRKGCWQRVRKPPAQFLGKEQRSGFKSSRKLYSADRSLQRQPDSNIREVFASVIREN